MQAAEINKKWKALQEAVAENFDMDIPDIKVMLFLIGVQELGKGPKEFSKREKEELMHIATCRLFSSLGFYELEGQDEQEEKARYTHNENDYRLDDDDTAFRYDLLILAFCMHWRFFTEGAKGIYDGTRTRLVKQAYTLTASSTAGFLRRGLATREQPPSTCEV